MLTKKHFKAIAKIIKNCSSKPLLGDPNNIDPHNQFTCGVDFAKSNISLALANHFKSDNPRFNQQKFYDACFKD